MKVLKNACGFYVIEFTRDDIKLMLEGVKSTVKIQGNLIEIRKLAGD